MVKLKIKRPYGRKSQSENSSAPRITQVKRQLALTEENKKEFQPALELGAMKENTLSNIAVIPKTTSRKKVLKQKVVLMIVITSRNFNVMQILSQMSKPKDLKS